MSLPLGEEDMGLEKERTQYLGVNPSSRPRAVPFVSTETSPISTSFAGSLPVTEREGRPHRSIATLLEPAVADSSARP